MPSLERESLIFASTRSIFNFNFITAKITTIYKYKKPFEVQPQFFKMNDSEKILMVSTHNDTLYVNTKT